MNEWKQFIEDLTNKEDEKAFSSLEILIKMSSKGEEVYAYYPYFIELMQNERSFVRIRAFSLLAFNAQYDSDKIFEENFDVLFHIMLSEKPLILRQYLKVIPALILGKPFLKEDIFQVLNRIDLNVMKDSM